MAKQSLLVADADPRSLRILDVALRKAGFSVATASDGAEAMRRLQREPPDLVLADVALPVTDGLALAKAIRADAKLAGTPVILISGAKDANLKLTALQAGADDFLGKPLLIKELTGRIKMLLASREQQKLAQRENQSSVSGAIGEMGLVDLIQSLDANGRSAIIACEEKDRAAQIWVRDGQVIDAEAGALWGDNAFYRVLGWEQGKFTAQFAPVDREARITSGTQALLAESVRRVDELQRLAEVLPLTSILKVDFEVLNKRLADLPDEVNGVIRLCDGVRTIAEVMERAPIDELSVLAVLQRLIEEKVLIQLAVSKGPKSKPSLAQWLGPNSVATPAPPIMGAHGRPISGDPTPIAPPVSDPPVATVFARPARASADSPQLTFDTPADPVPAAQFDRTPADPVRAPAPAPLDKTPSDPVPAHLRQTPPRAFPIPVMTPLALDKTPADPVPAPRLLDTTPADPVPAFLANVTPADPSPAGLRLTPPAPSQPVPAPAPVAVPLARISPAHVISPVPQAKGPAVSPEASTSPGYPIGQISPDPVATDLFKLPARPREPVSVVHFSPLRGVRRERLRREADEARALVSSGKPVRLTHVVELPMYPAGPLDPRRRISPAVGDAAKKFAPDLALGAAAAAAELARVEASQEPLLLQPIPEDESPTALSEQPVQLPAPDDGDLFGDSATLQSEPLSQELLGDSAPAPEPLPAPTPIESIPAAASSSSPDSSGPSPALDPAALQLDPALLKLPEAAPLPAPSPTPAPAEAVTPAEAVPSPSLEAPALSAPPASSGATSGEAAVSGEQPKLDSGSIEAPAPAQAALSAEMPASEAAAGDTAKLEPAKSDAPEGEKSPWDESTDPLASAPPPGENPHDAVTSPGHKIDGGSSGESGPTPEEIAAELARVEAIAAANTAESKPVKPTSIEVEPPPKKKPVDPADAEFDAAMRAAGLGKGGKKRWPIYAAVAAAVLVAAFFLRPQPPTDKKDSPWLEDHADDNAAAHPAAPAAAPTPAPAPAPENALDAGAAEASAGDAGAAPSADAGALAAEAKVPEAPPAANPEAPAAVPANDAYAKALADGESLIKRMKYRQAIVELKKAVALNADAVPALLELGDAYLEVDQPRSAIKPLEKAAKLDPRSSRAQLLLGTALQSLGKNGDAVKAYQRYLEMDPTGEWARDVRSILANLRQ